MHLPSAAKDSGEEKDFQTLQQVMDCFLDSKDSQVRERVLL